jgi:cytochrome c-type protein NapB
MRRRSASDTIARALGIAAVIVLMGTLVVVVGQALAEKTEMGGEGFEGVKANRAERPIALEAGVFRLAKTALAVPLDAPLDPRAEPRRLAWYRSLRAFSGAPPRIPHGLTAEEFRLTRCESCHVRGGYVARFGKYAPLTPHPEYRDCLSCHVPDGSKVGIGFPNPADPVVCGQCHPVPEVRFAEFAPLDWQPAEWPGVGQRALPGAPPLIPHGLDSRNNCLACHGGPGAVEEIRTRHPERASCLQCHVTAPLEEEDFRRP